jgi:hypothetical protein
MQFGSEQHWLYGITDLYSCERELHRQPKTNKRARVPFSVEVIGTASLFQCSSLESSVCEAGWKLQRNELPNAVRVISNC